MIEQLWQMVEQHEGLLAGLAVFSVVALVGSALALPFLAARLPEDYFVDQQRHTSSLRQFHPVVYLLLRVAKNLVGWTLILAGIAMLVLPGQGLLTIIVGVILCDFPGKFRLERWIACRHGVMRAINWLRQRAGHGPMLAPKRPDGTHCH